MNEYSGPRSIQTKSYWDEVVKKVQAEGPLDAWRSYMRFVYRKLIAAWLHQQDSVALKTDLFEEAVSSQCPLADLGDKGIGLDVSLTVARSAQQKFSENGKVASMFVSDLRNVALRSDSIQRILSGSSLDHFENRSDFLKALSELARILAPGGVLVLTLDNPANPVIWLRNRLPFQLLNRAGVVPYYVGITCGLKDGRRELEHLGLKVTHATAVVHVPRIAAVHLTRLMERWKWKRLSHAAEKIMEGFEMLERLPTRYFTGYYLAFRATKPL